MVLMLGPQAAQAMLAAFADLLAAAGPGARLSLFAGPAPHTAEADLPLDAVRLLEVPLADPPAVAGPDRLTLRPAEVSEPMRAEAAGRPGWWRLTDAAGVAHAQGEAGQGGALDLSARVLLAGQAIDASDLHLRFAP